MISSNHASLAPNSLQPQDNMIRDDKQSPNRNTTEVNDQPVNGIDEESPPPEYTVDNIAKHFGNHRQWKYAVDGTDTRDERT